MAAERSLSIVEMLSGASRALGRAHIDLAAGIFSKNTLLCVGFRDWRGEVMHSRVFYLNRTAPLCARLNI